jgi:bacterioferritin (cytochrome b1)
MTAFAGGADPTSRRLFEEILAHAEHHACNMAGMLKELGRLHTEHLIDESLQETFPASDAPAPAVDVLQGK